jgi:hypothetical protein
MQKILALILTLMLSGRAMTLAFIHRAGGEGPGDPPLAWLMPLLGDAIVGLSGLAIAYLIYRHRGLFAWTAVVVWNCIAIWDAMSAYIIHRTVPWPDFFMIQMMGSSMFFMASAMHLIVLYLVLNDPLKSEILGRREAAN